MAVNFSEESYICARISERGRHTLNLLRAWTPASDALDLNGTGDSTGWGLTFDSDGLTAAFTDTADAYFRDVNIRLSPIVRDYVRAQIIAILTEELGSANNSENEGDGE